jgi:YfiH family protein
VNSLFRRDEQFVYRVLPWLELDWLEHGFGTRQSEGWNEQPELISLTQVHSDVSLYADGSLAGRIGEGDALLTDAPGALVGVRTADCVPILIADDSKRKVAAVHAGWRGTAQAIAAKTVGAMAARFGSHARNLQAAIGPAIGACCYEVGPEVASQFWDLFPGIAGPAERTHLDLPEANRRQLLSAGVPPDRIYLCGLCTACLAEEFFSWRRDRVKHERMVSAIGIRRDMQRGREP